MEEPTKDLPLKNLIVLDLTRFRSGPTCVRQLADWGANVIKIEQPISEDKITNTLADRNGSDFQNLHRNKRSICLNLKKPEGYEILLQLTKKADIFVENYRPNVKHRLKIDNETLHKINKRLIYASISGFGQDGPYSKRPGFDQVAQGLGGLMSVTGLKQQGPVRAGIPVADLSAGLFGAIGILLALYEREQTGLGKWVRTSLLEAMVSMMDFQAARWLFSNDNPEQAGNDHPTTIPTGVFPTSDGFINIATAGNDIYSRLCIALKLPDLIDDPRFSSAHLRSHNRKKLNSIISETTSKKTQNFWIKILNNAEVPCGPINTMSNVFSDPQVQHLKLAKKIIHPSLGEKEILGQPIQYGENSYDVYSAAPNPGEHTVEILTWLGYEKDTIEKLRNINTIQ